VRELKVETERKTQLLDVTDRVHAALEGAEGAPVTLLLTVTR
jgi:thiamine phosphate synthase YjbQ (UPF0047 family)